MKKLSWKIALVTAMGMIVVLAGMIGIIFKNNNETVERSISGYSVSIAESLAAKVDTNLYEQFLNNPSETDTYWTLRKRLNEARELTGAFYVYTVGVEDKQPVILIDGQPAGSEVASPIGEETSTTSYADIKPVLKGKSTSKEIVKDKKYGDYLSAFAPIKNSAGEVIGIIGIDVDARKVGIITHEVNLSVLPVIIGFMVLLVVAIIAILTIFLNKRLRPIGVLMEASNQMAEGNFVNAQNALHGIKVKGKDEIPQLLASFEKMALNTSEMILDIKHSANQLLSAANKLGHEMGGIHESSGTIVHSIQHVASATDIQLESSMETTKAIDEIAIGVHRIAEAASEVSESSVSVTEQAKEGYSELESVIGRIEMVKESVEMSSETVLTLGKKADEIKTIVALITGISEQTNLLALNAAIEAARAGEHGKGFAVVSQEVRKLAEESKNSAARIEELLNTFRITIETAVESMNKSVNEVKLGTSSIQNTGHKFIGMLQSIEAVSAEIEEVSAVTEQISAGAEEISSTVNEFTRLLKETASASKEASASTDVQADSIGEIAELTTSLRDLSQKLENSVKKFIT
ncbi:HAMP domain-containing protein [Bacillus sp. ISL-35]|uniref:methyl-accepting chemotaxis protein n=1 Tax=Bacillus sp. ISL-35 TaxID=2819122 RepID=UPI001BEC4E66|nr:methyl-accepting chemotaxis protein [Bacillus sp. ISL-35]MBT2680581.1 HAMP domain-containing protein [Bacillus sp. ISL-35]MBT2704124.1 HAMP domain-containing protein [Chryseobacterium sp. ISL-80]